MKDPPQTAAVVIMRACVHRETMTLTCREWDRNALVAEERRKKCRACRYIITINGRDEFTPAAERVFNAITDSFAKAGLTIDSLDGKRFRDCCERLEDHSWLPLTAE